MKAKKDYSKIKMSWHLYFCKDNEVGSITFVYNPVLDKGAENLFTYLPEDVIKLERLRKEIPPPKFSQDVVIAQDQLREYSQMLKNKLK